MVIAAHSKMTSLSLGSLSNGLTACHRNSGGLNFHHLEFYAEIHLNSFATTSVGMLIVVWGCLASHPFEITVSTCKWSSLKSVTSP